MAELAGLIEVSALAVLVERVLNGLAGLAWAGLGGLN